MVKKNAWLVVSLLIATALVLSSCTSATTTAPTGAQTVTGKTTETTTTATTTTPTTTATTTTTPAAPVVDTGPKYGGILNIYGWDPKNWDPAFAQHAEQLYIHPVVGTLVTIDWWKGPAGTNEMPFELQYIYPPSVQTGDIAESWEIFESGSVVFHLREGVMWQNKPGIMSPREVTADDIVWNFERFMATPTHEYATNTPKPIAVTAIDRYTVKIELDEPSAFLLTYGLPMYYVMIPPEVVEQFGDMSDWRNVTGSGPWMLTDYVSGSSVTYKRNPNYHAKDPEGGSLPYLDGFNVLVIPEVETQLTALRSGQLDLMQGVTWQSAESLEITNPELQRRGQVQTWILKLMLKTNAPPLGPIDDPNALLVRRAMSMAIDRPGIVEGYYQGNAQMLTSAMAPGLSPRLEVANLPESSRELFEYNPERARELLIEAGYPNGIKIQIGTYYDELLSIVKANWDDVGIETELVIRDSGAHWALLLKHDLDDVMHVEWGFSGGGTTFASPGGVPEYWNMSEVDDAEYNARDLIIDAEFDESLKTDLNVEQYLRVIDQVWEMYLPTPYIYNYWQPWVAGYSGEMGMGDGNGQLAYVNYIWIEEDLR